MCLVVGIVLTAEQLISRNSGDAPWLRWPRCGGALQLTPARLETQWLLHGIKKRYNQPLNSAQTAFPRFYSIMRLAGRASTIHAPGVSAHAKFYSKVAPRDGRGVPLLQREIPEKHHKRVSVDISLGSSFADRRGIFIDMKYVLSSSLLMSFMST